MISSLILVITLFSLLAGTTFAATYPNAASKDFADGGRLYNAYMSKTANSEYITPVFETQIYHTKGTQSYIGITEEHGSSWTGSGDITAGYSGIFIDLSASIGVTKTTTHSISTTVAFTIPEDIESGHYRIEHRCPKYTVREILSDITNFGISRLFQNILQDMPGVNAGYYVLNKYQ